jgi:hypothetical protein
MATTSDGDANTGEIFDILSSHRRRYTIHYCKHEGTPVTISDLAEQVAAWEQEKEVAELTSAERKTVYTSLQQTHLPTLDDAGMIEYENGVVELTDRADDLSFYLDVVPGDSVPWGVYYLGLSAIGFTVLGGVAAGFVPTGTVPAVGWAAIVLAVFAGSAGYHTYQNRRYRLGEMEEPR